MVYHQNKSGNVAVHKEAQTLRSNASHSYQGVITVETAHTKANMREGRFSDTVKSLDGGNSKAVILPDTKIRRLTPIECERLQGFPDGWTKFGKTIDGKIIEISDTNRYKMLGNAVTVNVITWLGERLKECLN